MTPAETLMKNTYSNIKWVLWALKVPEVLFTFATIIGFILFVLGIVPYTVPVFAFCIRLILFPVRILIVREKRKMEKTMPSLKSKWVSSDVGIRKIISRLEMLQIENTMRIQRWIGYVIGRKK